MESELSPKLGFCTGKEAETNGDWLVPDRNGLRSVASDEYSTTKVHRRVLMRRLLFGLALILVLTLGSAALMQPTEAAGSCFFMCGCNGVPLKCCPSLGGGVSCKPTNEIGCPQIADC